MTDLTKGQKFHDTQHYKHSPSGQNRRKSSL